MRCCARPLACQMVAPHRPEGPCGCAPVLGWQVGLVFVSTFPAYLAGFACSASTGACEADDIGTHLLRSVDYQIVETVIASEAQTCSEQDPLADAIAGRMLCEVLHATTIAGFSECEACDTSGFRAR